MMCGGTSPLVEADEKIQRICESVSTKEGCREQFTHSNQGLCFAVFWCCYHVIVAQVKSQAEQKAGKSYDVFVAKTYTKQAVAGTNYFIKVISMFTLNADYVFKGLTACHKVDMFAVWTHTNLSEC